MASEVEMDKSAVGVKTLMEKSCNSQRQEGHLSLQSYLCSAGLSDLRKPLKIRLYFQ